MCGLQIVKGLKVSLGKRKNRENTGYFATFLLKFGERIFSPNAGGVFTKGTECDCAHFDTPEGGNRAGMSD